MGLEKINFPAFFPNLTESQAELAGALGKFREEVIEELGFQVNPPWLIDQFGIQYRQYRKQQQARAAHIKRLRREQREKRRAILKQHLALEQKRAQEFKERCAPPQRIIEGQFCKRIADGPYWYLHGRKRWVLRPKSALSKMRGALIRQGFNRIYSGWHRHAGSVEKFVEFFEDTQDAAMIWVSVATNRERTFPERFM